MGEKVCAVIVTYNRKALLRECLQAVLSQTRPPDHVLVVDNASTDGTGEMLREEFPEVEVLRLPENQGGAGGFHEGMKRAYEEGFEWIWVMDDDAFPEASALAQLMRYSSEAVVLVPILKNSVGSLYGVGHWKGRYIGAYMERKEKGPFKTELFSFVGPLFHRSVFQEVGLPRKDFFLQFDDVEYSLRIRQKKLSVLCIPAAIIEHDYGRFKEVSLFGFLKRKRAFLSPTKVYYSVRNYGWTVFRAKLSEPRLVSLGIYLVMNLRWLIGDLLFEPDRWTYLRMRVLGIWHGLVGRLGRYPAFEPVHRCTE